MLNGNGSRDRAPLPDPGAKTRFQVSEEVPDILDLGMGIGRVGEGGKIMRAARRDASGYCGDKFGLGPAADAVLLIWRNVRRVKRSETATVWQARRRA